MSSLSAVIALSSHQDGAVRPATARDANHLTVAHPERIVAVNQGESVSGVADIFLAPYDRSRVDAETAKYSLARRYKLSFSVAIRVSPPGHLVGVMSQSTRWVPGHSCHITLP
jgi:hypothetical protein